MPVFKDTSGDDFGGEGDRKEAVAQQPDLELVLYTEW